MLKAAVNVVASLVLPCSWTAMALSGLVHREKTARGLVDVDDAVCADCVLVHEPAQGKHLLRVKKAEQTTFFLIFHRKLTR